ncbi:MAG: M12 family metallo-peptidase [Flavobacterium sp.]|uniref:zinc-dependent metalloprotease n=1 Tax=Flavobacterium sp. TaxID=239 RepID=UPI0025C39419|nr:zinc-dependent metalloprotease family protein [Flavobacterium sp.]MCK6607811.1 M12 family metallo-peptidase [Flavobacterium sp.]
MKKKIHFLLVFIVFVGFSYGQSKLWTKVSEEKLGGLEKMERASVPSVYQIMHLDLNAFKQSLVGAPVDTEAAFSNTIVNFPNSKGELSRFRVYEAPIMEKGLADRYPDIKSYAAVGVDNPSVKLRFSVTLFGLHVMSTSGDEGTYYIDTYTKDLNNYIVYNRKDLYTVRTFACHFQDNHEEIAEQNRSAVENQTLATDGKFRQYRLAMACTIEYAAFHVTAAGLGAGTLAQKKAAVLSAMNVTMTRVNGIYERDMSLRMNLVANNDLVIFIDSDNFSNDDAENLIDESQAVINGTIGSANYDIGHTVSTGGGGLAGLGVVCNSTNKARGITGSPSPVGDPYDIDYVAHEMGHQFGGPHTFSSNDDPAGYNCNSGNVSSANAVEPGSGSTIMAYAGICVENVQSNSDAYFHAVSIASMNAVMIGSGNCAPQTNNGNNPPVIAALSNYTIPKGTAFVLTGNATDANAGASLTYCWEQTNAAAGTNYPTSTQTSGPVYRSLNPTTSNKRYFPNFQSVLSGNLAPTWEVTPTVGRTLNFALTVRDNQTPTGGQTARANMTVTTVAAAGPFAVTSPAANASWNTNSSQTITWNVAGTTANGINTANVNILLSTDNGATFTTLLANTPNDGSQAVTMPATAAVNCRILVEAVGNVYYAVSPNFSIGYTVTNVCNSYTMNTGFAIPDNNTAFTVRSINVPTTSNITDVNLAVNLTHTYVSDLQIILQGPMVTTTQSTIFSQSCTNNDNINATFDDQGAGIVCAPTITGSVIPTTSLGVFNGLNPNGNWLVGIRDIGAADTGNVVSYTLTVCSQTVTLSSDSFGLENFTLYPNPNNGNFNIQFTSTSGNEIKVNIHDIRGREIYSKSYTNNGLFNENLQLSNVQSGVYLVTVQDGSRKEVKKIVVQ